MTQFRLLRVAKMPSAFVSPDGQTIEMEFKSDTGEHIKKGPINASL